MHSIHLLWGDAWFAPPVPGVERGRQWINSDGQRQRRGYERESGLSWVMIPSSIPSPGHDVDVQRAALILCLSKASGNCGKGHGEKVTAGFLLVGGTQRSRGSCTILITHIGYKYKRVVMHVLYAFAMT
jgi:hypothetical protein